MVEQLQAVPPIFKTGKPNHRTFAPDEILDYAVQEGLQAIVDHDWSWYASVTGKLDVLCDLSSNDYFRRVRGALASIFALAKYKPYREGVSNE